MRGDAAQATLPLTWEQNRSIVDLLRRETKGVSHLVLEASLIEYVGRHFKVNIDYAGIFSRYAGHARESVINLYEDNKFPVDVEFITQYFESLLEENSIVENGIAFTRLYLADYICMEAERRHHLSVSSLVLDPGCGCGIFLAAWAIRRRKETSAPFARIYQNLFGIDIEGDNVRRCMLVLGLLPLFFGEGNFTGMLHIAMADSLKCDWNTLFGVEAFDFITGNPPYVNPHDMRPETVSFLKSAFETTRSGVFNIFYAFVEHGMKYLSHTGILSYIVPNNFLAIKAARDLRRMMVNNRWLESVIDFGYNMVFKPIRTYNCIICLSHGKQERFTWAYLNKTADIPSALLSLPCAVMETERLGEHGWNLVDSQTYQNILRIENQLHSIKPYIRTGIATLKDSAYMVEGDGENFYKEVDGKRYAIDASLVRTLYKISDLKHGSNIEQASRYIIFPYKMGPRGYIALNEDELRANYNNTWVYLNAQKPLLATRDKGKTRIEPWYAYGRTQGLNRYGKKILFPTFANKPKFIMSDDETSLFCNGYALFGDDSKELELLCRICNSKVMWYYISKTSYAIEGGYYCYQKKYVERFSIPYLTESEKAKMLLMSDEQLDDFLKEKYGLSPDVFSGEPFSVLGEDIACKVVK